MLSVRIVQMSGLQYETDFPSVSVRLSYGTQACTSKQLKKTAVVQVFQDFSFSVPKKEDFLIIEVNETDGKQLEPIAAARECVPDAYMRDKPNNPQMRKLELDGGGTMSLSVSYVVKEAPTPVSSAAYVRHASVSSGASRTAAPAPVDRAASVAGSMKKMAMHEGPMTAFHVTDGTPTLVPGSHTFDEPLGPTEVEIRVQAVGISQMDRQFAQNKWGMTAFPYIPGCEIAGVISACGPSVESVRPLSVGQRVGLGLISNACWACDLCKSGKPQLCDRRAFTILEPNGGMSEYVRCDCRMAMPLPKDIQADKAAVLMGAGMAAFAPVDEFVKEGMEVAIVGLGGVGHLASGMAGAKGAKITSFSSDKSKEDPSNDKWNGYFFVRVPQEDAAIPAGYTMMFDLVIFTVPAPYSWLSLLRSLKDGGRLVVVGSCAEHPTIPPGFHATFDGQRTAPFPEDLPTQGESQPGDREVTVSFSNGGSPDDYARMLKFCVEKKIAVDVEGLVPAKAPERFSGATKGKALRSVVLMPTQ